MSEQILQYCISSLINIAIGIYVISRILSTKTNFKSYKLYLAYFSLVIIAILNAIYISGFVRIVIMTASICVANYYYFRKDFRQTLASSFLLQILAFISEIIYAIFAISIVELGSISIEATFFGNILTNIIISILMCVIVSLPLISKIFDKLVLITNKINIKILAISLFMLFLPINILVYASYSQLEITQMLVINVFFILIFVFIMIMALNEKNENLKYKTENSILIKNLNDYEKMMDHQRVANHENKNQLVVIKGMISKKDKGVIEYINEIVKDTLTDNENLLSKAKKIPSGGLQGLVYKKMLTMSDKGIKPNLEINKNIKEFKFQNMLTKNNYNLCRVIGVLLDNAIEESTKTKEKEIKISMYVDDCFVIEISNYFKDCPDLDKIDEKGFTTKGSGHGYGLSLVKEIIDSTKEFENSKTITKNVFTQIIKIKM